jgi:hypothetical protein
VGRPTRISRKVWFFEHGVHGGLRAHDLARREGSIQDGFTARLLLTCDFLNGCLKHRVSRARCVWSGECNRQRDGCLKHLFARNGRLYSPNYPRLLNERIHDR